MLRGLLPLVISPVMSISACPQGLTHIHVSAKPKPFWSHLPVSRCSMDWGTLMHPTYHTKSAHVELKKWTSVSPCTAAITSATSHIVDCRLCGELAAGAYTRSLFSST